MIFFWGEGSLTWEVPQLRLQKISLLGGSRDFKNLLIWACITCGQNISPLCWLAVSVIHHLYHLWKLFLASSCGCFDAAILVWQEPNMNLWDLINQWNECWGPTHYDVTANRAARSSPSTATLGALAKVARIALSRSSPCMNLVLRWELSCATQGIK